jgi:UDP-N-acetyl-D-mannosaminuronic acid dehydrogenase
MLALGGVDVAGYDVDPRVLASLRAGAAHVKESSVRTLAVEALAGGRLTLASELAAGADAYIICVPTPTRQRKPDLSHVEAAARAVAGKLAPGALVILESTVPPGTTERVLAGALRAAGIDLEQVAVVHCPERVIPGDIVRELRENARVVGGRKPGDAEPAAALYATFCTGRITTTDLVTAELSKVMENTYRDVNIALANEFALLCEELGVDVYEAIALANQHPRVDILRPGPGVGGHCIPIDPQFLADAHPLVTELIQASRRVNERMPHVVLRRLIESVPPGAGACVALLGAAYKANVDDTRESPTEHLEALLLERGFSTRVYDPLAERYARPLTTTLEEAVRGADALVLMAGHDAFAAIDPHALAPLCRARNLIDTRAFFPAGRWTEAGFTVYTLGRGRRSPQPVAGSA